MIISRLTKSAVVMGAFIGATNVSASTTLNFDDHYGFLPTSYHGLIWDSSIWFASDQAPPYNAHSGTQVLVDAIFAPNSDHTLVQFPSESTFESVYISGNAIGTITFKFYLSGNLVATSGTITPSAISTLYTSTYSGLTDKIVVTSPYPGFYALDDFTFSAAVPEAQSASMLGLGVFFLGVRYFALRRSKSRSAKLA